MNAFVSSVMVICSSLLVAAILKLLTPLGNSEKIIKRIISLFVLVSIATCGLSLTKAFSKGDIIDYEPQDFENAADSEILTTTADYLADYIVSLLESENIKNTVSEVKIEADINSVINVTEVVIYISKEQISSREKIIEIIEANLMLTPEVAVKEQ